MDQGLPYYLKFTEAFPTIRDLAESDEKDVLRLWQGLGYYSRARNLHHTAKHISKSFGGKFPDNYDEILKLKGVGPYTAAAIASICFDEPKPVVDGNVFRFAARYFGIENDIAKLKTRNIFEKILEKHISIKTPGAFNQAMMEYGATICSPSPLCDQCDFQDDCISKQKGIHKSLPVKSKKLKVRNRFLHYLVLTDGSSFLLKKRSDNDVWAHLFDFPLIEGEHDQEFVLKKVSELMKEPFTIKEISMPFQHLLSHQKITAVFYQIKGSTNQIKKLEGSTGSTLYSVEEIVNLPKPKLIVNYFQKIGIKS